MARHVVSILRSAPPALRRTDPALEANAFAVAEDVDLTVVLRAAAVELALSAGEVPATDVAGVTLPHAPGAQDLRGLVESGVRVVAEDAALAARGVDADDLVHGVEVVDAATLNEIVAGSEGVLTW